MKGDVATREIKSRVGVAKASFSKYRALFTGKMVPSTPRSTRWFFSTVIFTATSPVPHKLHLPLPSHHLTITSGEQRTL
jgi:hypothetical protein